MIYNDPTDKQGVVQDTLFLLGNAVTLNDYKIEDITRNANVHFFTIWQIIFESYNGYKFLDTNLAELGNVMYSDIPFSSGDKTIDLPEEALTVNGVWIQLTSGSWQKLQPMTEEQFLQRGGESTFDTDNISGVPIYYRLFGNKVVFLDKPNFNGTARVYFDESISKFAIDDTDVVPGFVEQFHRMLSIGAALDYAASHDSLSSKVPGLTQNWLDYEQRLRKFYSKRWQDRTPANLSNASGSSGDLMSEFS